jgi:hypothetical protein
LPVDPRLSVSACEKEKESMCVRVYICVYICV